MKIYTIGGYSEVGKNMTLVEANGNAFIFDCGLYLPPIVELEKEKREYTEKKLKEIEAIPNDDIAREKKVREILISHAHLDHVGALSYLEKYYSAKINGTPFTIEVFNSLMKDLGIKPKNRIRKIQPNSGIKEKDYEVEFINMTHSTPQTAMLALHTKKGSIVYANDFKFDNYPIVGKKPNYKKLRELRGQVKVLIVESLYADLERKTPSERIARDLLHDVLLGTENSGKAIFVTTFSSHIARLKSIIECASLLDRKPVLIGRSLARYTNAAKKIGIAEFLRGVKVVSFRKDVERTLRQIKRKRHRWLVIVTGHQGEPGSILDRLARGVLPFKFEKEDHVIFSSSVIPTPVNQANRQELEKRLKERGVRIFTDVHVSGHCGREDLRDLIKMLEPEHIIPAHGELQKLTALADLASELGYDFGKDVHLSKDGGIIRI